MVKLKNQKFWDLIEDNNRCFNQDRLWHKLGQLYFKTDPYKREDRISISNEKINQINKLLDQINELLK